MYAVFLSITVKRLAVKTAFEMSNVVSQMALYITHYTLFFRNVLKKTDSRQRFDACYAAVRRVVRSYNIEPVTRPSDSMFCALSFYVDRGIDTKMIGIATLCYFVMRGGMESRLQKTTVFAENLLFFLFACCSCAWLGRLLS